MLGELGPARVVAAVVVVASAFTVGTAVASNRSATESTWFSAWSRPQSVAIASAADPLNGGRGPGPLVDQTVRNIVRVTGAGSAVRIRLSNRYGATLSADGSTPLHVKATTVARRSMGAGLLRQTLRGVTFGGRHDVTIAPGATVVSDPVSLPLVKGDDIAVSLHLELVPMAPQHGASFATSYVSPSGSGDRTRDVRASAFTERTLATLILSGIDVRSTRLRGVVAATGGSVTDGHGSGVDRYTDFPSWLSRRLDSRTVVNNGLGGTTAAAACAVPGTGPSVEERVAHDSLRLPGLTHLIVYAGTNDIAGVCTAEQIIAAYRSILRQSHERGVRVLISTITPRAAYTAAQNAEREKVNRWVRSRGTCSGECERSLDFDLVVRDAADRNRIDPELDSGDGIHPSGEGYRRIAASIPLAALS
jgi:lysophospholipase L1-like esterase